MMSIVNSFSMDEVESFWDSVADIYESANEKVSSLHLQRFNESVKLLKLAKSSRILNIWSRTGLANSFLRRKQQDLDITNAELSLKMIEIAKIKFPNERFDKVDLHKLPYPDCCFDEILSLETLEHVQLPLVFLKELNRVLKPKGRLVMSLPPRTAELALKIYNLFCKHHGEGPHRFINPKQVKLMLSEAGFYLILHKPTLFIPVNIKFISDFGEVVLEKFGRGCLSAFGIRHFYVCEKL